MEVPWVVWLTFAAETEEPTPFASDPSLLLFFAAPLAVDILLLYLSFSACAYVFFKMV